MKDLCDFCEKVYVRHDQSGFKGNPAFLRNQYSQKTYAKLRNSIASSIYQWRAGGAEGAKEGATARARMSKEAEFGLKQAFALCPYEPEPVYQLLVLYSDQRRSDETRMILNTALHADPTNTYFAGWLKSFNDNQKQP